MAQSDMAKGSKTTAATNSGIRIALSLLVGLSCGIFILLWDGNHMSHGPAPAWLGAYVLLPLVAVITSFASNSLIQYLNCGQVQWKKQLGAASIAPVPIIVVFILISYITSLRWPIEGLAQSSTPEFQKGLSSGYYGFWLGMYIQNFLGGTAQICPN
jgi:hypothetical protein